MTTAVNVGSPYRIPAPPPPGPTWWERNRDRVQTSCAISVVLLGLSGIVTCICKVNELDNQTAAETVRRFEELVKRCPIIEIDRGRRDDPVMVLLDCGTIKDRRRVPPGYKLP